MLSFQVQYLPFEDYYSKKPENLCPTVESFIAKQKAFLNIDPTEVSDTFYMDWEKGEFIFCVHKDDKNGKIIPFPKEISLPDLINNITDTTPSMFSPGCLYREYTKDELIKLSKNGDT